jgi:predicted amidophosphoribosyltransferase
MEAVPRLVGERLVARAAYVHTGLAKRLVHDLKYRGLVGRAAALAPGMTAKLPERADSLVPVPRSLVRRLQLGVDPGLELAIAVGKLAGLRVDRLLVPPVWQPRHAGKGRDRRAPVRFRARAPAPPGTVVVDDVLTTGATLTAASAVLGPGVIAAVTATAAGV